MLHAHTSIECYCTQTETVCFHGNKCRRLMKTCSIINLLLSVVYIRTFCIRYQIYRKVNLYDIKYQEQKLNS